MLENAAAEICLRQLHGLLNTEWFRGFYGSISEWQKVQEVHTLMQYVVVCPCFFVSRLEAERSKAASKAAVNFRKQEGLDASG